MGVVYEAQGLANLLAHTDHQYLFQKWANPGLFNRSIFGVFKQTSLQFLQQINVKKWPFSIRRQDSNSQPSDYESHPLTTRPAHPPSILVEFT